MSTINSTEVTRDRNTTDGLLGWNLTLACRISKPTWTTRGKAADGEADDEGLSEGETLMEIEADEEVDGESEGDADALGESDEEIDDEGD